MKHKVNVEIPYLYPTDHHIAPFQEVIGYDPYVNYIGVMRDAIEKAAQDRDDLY